MEAVTAVETTAETTVARCPVEGCGKEYKNNSGLSSHMAMVHKLNRNGEPVPEGDIARRKKNLSRGVRQHFAAKDGPSKKFNFQRPEVQAKIRAQIAARQEKRAKIDAAITKAMTKPNQNIHSDSYYVKLAAKGIFRCPECSRVDHKTVNFSSPAELGRHRRFKHGVLGRNHVKAEHAQERRHKAQLAAPTTSVPPETTVIFPCPHCSRTFPKQHGLSIHISQAHKHETALAPSTSHTELKNGHASTQGVTINPLPNGQGRNHTDDAAYVTTVAISNLAGKLQGILLAASDELNLAPRDLARRCILVLSEHYST